MLGWIGSVCFALCGLPQVVKSIKNGHACGLSLSFLLLWIAGEVCYVVATIGEFGFVGWMMFNYLLNIVCIVILIFYKIKGKSKC